MIDRFPTMVFSLLGNITLQVSGFLQTISCDFDFLAVVNE